MDTSRTLDVPTTAVRSVESALRAVGATLTDQHTTPGAVGYTTITVAPARALNLPTVADASRVLAALTDDHARRTARATAARDADDPTAATLAHEAAAVARLIQRLAPFAS